MLKLLKMVANRKDREYFAKSLNVIQKDSVGKETFVQVYEEKKTRIMLPFTKKFISIHYLT